MSENNSNQFKMPPKRPRGPMGRGPGMVTEKAKDFKLYKEAHKVSRQILGCHHCSYDICSSFDCLLRCRTEGHG